MDDFEDWWKHSVPQWGWVNKNNIELVKFLCRNSWDEGRYQLKMEPKFED